MTYYELNNSFTCDSQTLYATEHLMYGSSIPIAIGIGTDKRSTLLYINGHDVSDDTTTTTYRYLGKKEFELNNHLGNVLVTVTDKPIPKTLSTTVDYFEPEISTISDYYAFGIPIAIGTM